MSPIKTITVLGAGTMGRGIAHVAALSEFETRLYDVSRPALDQARASIEGNLDKGVARAKVEADAAAAAKKNLSLHTDLAASVTGSDLIIEAVPEDMVLKVQTFQQVAEHASDSCIFASNTSSLSITEMGTGSGRPDRFAGMHFFNPVHIMKLVELVHGLETSAETLDILHQVSLRMGKEIVVVNEAPGFVTSRINAMIGNEAFRMLESGVASAEDIDKALKLGLNHPMGPFEMVDLVGLDVRLSILQYLHSTLGEVYRPCPLLVQYVKAGRFGRKTGKGVYEYDTEGKRVG
ncbi:MAG: 3-hydroxyacyl-CoA dehydrogenase [Thermoanaerobaculia bacterium]|nr:3-hydroxyacyl-CoA dehydrogenase [Thermoanaerobaculia bacterium]